MDGLCSHSPERECQSPDRLLSLKSTIARQQETIRKYDQLVEDVRQHLDVDHSRKVVRTLAGIRHVIPGDTETEATANSPREDIVPDTLSPTSNDLATPALRYLGEASEVRFLSSIKHALSSNTGTIHTAPLPQAEVWDSYEQAEASPRPGRHQNSFSTPPRATADAYLKIYLSTIHIAYPFVCQTSFVERYETFWETGALSNPPSPWLSTLCGWLHSPCYQLY